MRKTDNKRFSVYPDLLEAIELYCDKNDIRVDVIGRNINSDYFCLFRMGKNEEAFIQLDTHIRMLESELAAYYLNLENYLEI